MAPTVQVLVIEDVDSDFRLIQRQIDRSALQARCRQASGAPSLDAALADGPWDVVLADHRLPGLAFEPLLRRLQQRLPGVPVILVSGAIGEEAAVDLLRLGVTDFVLKDRLARLVPAIERCLDDTRRRREAEAAAAALRDSEHFNSTVIHSLSDGLFIAQDRRFVFFNPALPRMLGYDAQAFARCRFEDVLDPEWLPLWTDRFEQRVRPTLPEPVQRYDAVFRGQDGRRIWVELHAERFTYRASPAVLGLVRDVTAQRSLMAELEAHRHRLEQLVDERTARAEAANRSKSVFLATMSHEIRTPLNAVTSKVYLMQREATDARMRQHLQVVDDAVQHLRHVVDGVLDLSKIESGRLVLERTAFSLDDLLARCSALMAERAREKALRFEVHNLAAGRWLHGDPTRLSQLLLNLLGNAVKFTERGSVQLRCSVDDLAAEQGDGAAPGGADAAARDPAGGPVRLVLQVQDSGIGIAPERLSQLFAPFEQAEVSTARRFGGTGLGLSIARSLAQLMDGDITVDSAPGRGSTFSAVLQLQAAPPEAARAASRNEQPALLLRQRHAGRRVLLADDNEINRLIGEELLAAVGLQTLLAEDGRQAVALAGANEVAAILLDLQMPELDGLQAAAEIRRLPGRTQVPIIALTASAMAEERAACLAAGMDAHLSKPVLADALYALLLDCMDRHG